MFQMFEKIKNGKIYIIAEMSANHAGKIENALEIVRKSAQAGADCVKIQTYTADTLTIDCDNDYFRIRSGLWDGYKLYDLYQQAGTPWEWHADIKRECEKCGVDFLSTPFDDTAVDFLEKLGCEAYKIASFEMVDIPLIEYAASKGKPIIISCGMGSPKEIQDAVDACRRVGNEQVLLLKCCSEYPASWENMHLANIPDMKKRYGVAVGLSDHSMGSAGAIVGAALGACVIEKHICLSRGIKSPDSEFSMEIEEFAQMVQDVRHTEQMLQGPEYSLSEKEKSSTIFRRSLFAVQEIGIGDEFTIENIRSIRPGYGIPPKHISTLRGRKSKRVIHRGEPITWEILEESKVPQLITNRLFLNGITEKDTSLIVKWRSNPEVYPYFLSPHPLNEEEHRDWFKNKYIFDETCCFWMAVQKDNGKSIGVFGIKRQKNDLQSAEVSYILAPECQGKGFGQEAVEEVIQFAKKEWGCREAIAEIHMDNEKSLQFAESLGFVSIAAKNKFALYKKFLVT